MPAPPLSHTFESGQADGTTITTGNSGTGGTAFNAVTGSPVYSTTQKHAGTLGMKVALSGGFTETHVDWTGLGTITSDVYFRAYVWMPSIPTTGPRLIGVRNSTGGGSAFLALEANTGRVSMLNAAQTAVTTGTVAIPTAAWFRVECRVKSATTNGEVEWRLYTSPDSTSIADSGSNLTAVLGAHTDRARWGADTVTGPALDWYIDDVAISTSGWIGPSSTPTAQHLAPSADSVVGSYTNQAGAATNLYQSIDETIIDDSDYVQSEVGPSSSSYRWKIAAGSDPASSTGHVFRWRAGKNPTDGAQLNGMASLRQGGGNALGGGTLIASWARNDITTPVTFEETLTGTQADAITNYGDLYGEVTFTQV